MANNVDVYVEAPDIIGQIAILNNYADRAIDSAYNISNSLSRFTPDSVASSVSFETVDSDIGITAPSEPNVPELEQIDKQPPAGPTINIPTVPDNTLNLSDPPVKPTINLPDVPSPSLSDKPVRNFTVTTDFPFPEEDFETLPTVPTLISLNIPTADSISIPIFDQTFPTSASLVPPGNIFSFTENLYSSTLLSNIQAELLSRLGTSTGLNPTVEQALFDRARSREDRNSIRSREEFLKGYSQTGFSRPTGGHLAALEDLFQKTQDKNADLSREIMIKQAELEQENFKFSIQQAISLEDILIRQHNNVQQRAFEVARYIQDIAIELYKAAINKFQLEIQAYQAFAVAYEARVRAELSKIEIFKAEIDAEKLKGEINQQSIQIYLAQLDAVKTSADIFKTRMEGISERIKAESLKLQNFKLDLDAYIAEIQANSELYKNYSEQIKGELAKVQIFDAEARAYASFIEALSKKTDLDLKEVDAQISVEGLKLRKYEVDIDAFIKTIQAEQATISSAIDIYRGQAQIYLAKLGLSSATAELKLKEIENTILQNRHASDVGLKNIDVLLENARLSTTSRLEGLKAAGQIYTQVAASSLNAINVGAQVQGQVGISLSESHNWTDQ